MGGEKPVDSHDNTHDRDYRMRLGNDWESEYHSALQRDEGFNLAESIRIAMVAKGLDKTDQELYDRVAAYSAYLAFDGGAKTREEANNSDVNFEDFKRDAMKSGALDNMLFTSQWFSGEATPRPAAPAPAPVKTPEPVKTPAPVPVAVSTPIKSPEPIKTPEPVKAPAPASEPKGFVNALIHAVLGELTPEEEDFLLTLPEGKACNWDTAMQLMEKERKGERLGEPLETIVAEEIGAKIAAIIEQRNEAAKVAAK
jgi:hypothetical protein